MIRASKEHLAEVDERYFEHFRAALGISAQLAKAAAACLVHAIVPGLCTRTASSCVAKVSAGMARRGRLTDDAPKPRGYIAPM